MVAEASRATFHEQGQTIASEFETGLVSGAFTEAESVAAIVPEGPPEYVFDLIQISIHASAGDIAQLITAVDTARARGAENREILRAMFRSDEAFGTGVEGEQFMRIAESLQAGKIPLPVV